QRIPSDLIYHIHRDRKQGNTIWLSTGGSGVIRVEIEEEGWTIVNQSQLTIVDGLSNNTIYAIYEDEFDHLWMSSDYGINRYQKEIGQLQVYTTKDGLPFNEFNRTAHHQAADGRIFFGTMNGVTSFHPKDFQVSEAESNIPLRITNFQQFNGRDNQFEDKTAALVQSNQILLQPKDKFLNFEFALLEYEDANQIKYSYQLSGQGDTWQYLNGNELRLSGIPYGKSMLKVRAQGVSGQAATTTIQIPITALRPIYQRLWFISLLLITLIAAIVYSIRWRLLQYRKRQAVLEQVVQERTQKIAQDKNTIERQAAELQRLDAMKTRFFANISHELRTPLTLMLAPIDAVLKEEELSNRSLDHLQIAQRNGQLLQHMINQILDLTKLEAGKLSLNAQTVDWQQLLSLILANFQPLADRKEIHLKFNYLAQPNLQLEIDKKAIEWILYNLLSNAIKFTPNGGQITLTTTETSENLSLKIADNGKGIAAEDLPHIFDRFYQTQRIAAKAEGGTGIGLSLVNELVKLMQGSIEVESGLHLGTTFSISLPKKEVEEILESKMTTTEIHPIQVQNTPTAVAAIHPNPFPNTSILLVEDNEDLRHFLQSLLSKHYQVITAANGQEALSYLASDDPKPQLTISDVMMPVLDGFQFLERLKSNEQYKHIPVIMLTARVELHDRLKALRIGVDDYLTKPFVEEELLVRVANLLRNAANRKAFQQEMVGAPTDILASTTLGDNWLEELEKIIIDKLDDIHLKIQDIAFELNMSERQLYRRIKADIGQTPNQYIKSLRLATARKLLEIGTYDSVKAVALSVGFKDIKYFSAQFKKEFGRLPSDYKENLG
ncbi:MAG: ATP-binding protein, partial [Bacteroidota bacterium]